MKTSQKFDIDGEAFARMKNLRILKLPMDSAVNFSGKLGCLSNNLRLLYWYGCPFKLLPSYFYPENIIAIDLSYSNIKELWTTPKSFRRLKVMKLRYCFNLTTTPDFSEITNLEELDLEGCVNLVSIHPSIGIIKRLVVLNLSGCLKVGQLPEASSWITTAITKVPSLFGGQGRTQPRWWTSIIAPFGLLSKQQHPQRSIMSSLVGLHMLERLNLSYCNLKQVPESIGGLSFLNELNLEGNNFSSLPGSLSQLSHLGHLWVNRCKKLEVLPELPPNIYYMDASDCTSLREVLGSFMSMNNEFNNCPNLFKNVNIDSEGSISKKKTECVDSSITSQASNIHQLSAFLGYVFLQTNKRGFFSQDFSYDKFYSDLDIIYHGNSMPEWFTNRSLGENHVKVELLPEEDSSEDLPKEDWYYDEKIKGYGTCVVFKCKRPFTTYISEWYSVKNFDGASLMTKNYIPYDIREYLKKEEIGIQDESYIIWLHYKNCIRWKWMETNNFVTFSFFEELNNEDVEVKECGVRLIYDEDIGQDVVTMLSMFHDLPTPTQNGGAMNFYETDDYESNWSWSW